MSFYKNKFICRCRDARRYLEKTFLSGYSKRLTQELKKVPPEDLERVVKPISFSYLRARSHEFYENNDLHGLASALKKYAGISEKKYLFAAIEHGFYFGDVVSSIDVEVDLPALITMGKYRQTNIAHWTKKPVKTIGPYLHYVENYYSQEQMKKLKKKLGRNLTVFPAHSTPFETVEQNFGAFCRSIKKIQKSFDSVTVCVYWKDYTKERVKLFKNFGFKVVSAGNMFDPFFLRRLKSIVQLADITASNEIGTILGYSIMLGKPQVILRGNEANYKGMRYAHDCSGGEDNYVKDKFSHLTDKINSEQRKTVNYYWGLDQVRSPKELKKIFLDLEKL